MNINNINTIARYEVKLVRRSWLFRIFAILSLLGISFVLLVNFTTIINRFDEQWHKIGLSSFIPFACTYFYNIAQSVIVIFLAGSFLKRDKKLDTAEVIYVRPMSNADYIIGKTWGIVKVFVSLNIIVLLIAAFLNILVNQSPFSVFPYFFYLFTISIPSLIFVLGLSFTMMCLLKNQAVTFIVMLGIIGMVFFYLSDYFFGVFDFFGVNIPAVFSEVTGHVDIRLFLLQRTIYLLAGAGMISFTIALVNRLPHKPWKIIIVNTIGAVLLLAASCAGLLYVLHYRHISSLRSEYVISFNRYADQKNADILTHNISITPRNNQVEGKSIVKIKNNHPVALNQIVFYLNPSLEVLSIESSGTPLPFKRDNQVVVVERKLQTDEELSVTIHYQGGITENICYVDVPDKDYKNTKITGELYRLGKRYAWLEDKFTLLTPECLWYPVTTAPVNPGTPYKLKKNFTDYQLSVTGIGNKTVLSQGKSNLTGDTVVFTNQNPLPGISLTIADYEKKSINVDSVDYEIYYFKGHDFFSSQFEHLRDTLPAIIRERRSDIEQEKDRNYLFSKFVMAETPAQFAAYTRNWKGYTEFVMPEIMFIPERGVTLGFDIQATKKRMKDAPRHNEANMNDTEIEINILRIFVDMVFNSSMRSSGPWNWENKELNPFFINPLFYLHTGFIRSEEYPLLDLALNSMQNLNQETDWSSRWGNTINNSQRANLYLETNSLQKAMADNSIKPEILYELLKLKSIALYSYIAAQVPEQEFTNFLKDFSRRNQFRSVNIEAFIGEFKQKFNVDLSDFVHKWYTEDHSPRVFVKDVNANEVVVDEITRYQINFKVNNPSDVDAIIKTEVASGGGRGLRMAMSFNMSSDNTKYYIIPAGKALEIKQISDDQPANITINTNISHNLPAIRSYNFPKIDNTISDTTSGIYSINPAIFAPNPDEIIVDNEDPGFKMNFSNNRRKLKDLLQKEEKEKYKNFFSWNMPSQWTAIAADYCYGETISSAVYKKKGSGANSIEWNAEIPNDGYYEISIWNPKMSMGGGMRRRGRGRGQEDRSQTYTIVSDKEKETVTLDLESEDVGWISIGNFYLTKGTATIALTDKVVGNYVIADAVKFAAIEQ